MLSAFRGWRMKIRKRRRKRVKKKTNEAERKAEEFSMPKESIGKPIKKKEILSN